MYQTANFARFGSRPRNGQSSRFGTSALQSYYWPSGELYEKPRPISVRRVILGANMKQIKHICDDMPRILNMKHRYYTVNRLDMARDYEIPIDVLERLIEYA